MTFHQEFNLINILSQAAKPTRLPIMFDKLVKKVFPGNNLISDAENKKWIEENLSNISEFARKKSPSIWEESKIEGIKIEKKANKKLNNIKYQLGGGAAYPLIYFLIRLLRPDIVVETGVAAGFSSLSILSALKKNKKGRLYSSDFPYFRIKDPEKYIGIVVNKNLRKNWKLLIEGDKQNLPKIINEVNKIDIFIYDSDKTYIGKKESLEKIYPLLTKDSLIIIDDIEIDSFFHDYIHEKKDLEWWIFKFEGKYFGLIGNL